MTTPDFNRTFQVQLDQLSRDLADVKDVVYGRPHARWQGVVTRVENTEQRVLSLKEIQDSFIRDQTREKLETDRKMKVRDRLQVAALSLIVTVFAGIVIQLFILLAGGAS